MGVHLSPPVTTIHGHPFTHLSTDQLANVYAFAEWAHEVFNCASQRDLSELCQELESMCVLFDRSVMLRELQEGFADEVENDDVLKDDTYTCEIKREVTERVSASSQIVLYLVP